MSNTFLSISTLNSRAVIVSFYLYNSNCKIGYLRLLRKKTLCTREGDMLTKRDVPERVVELNMLGKGSKGTIMEV